tara:strand:+ start:1150 stop:1404 length:255 start_codon:yes stop_codon:yes gene_type:complete
MKNYKTVFQDLNDRCSFECNHDVHDEERISINISIESNETTDKDSFICLDIESAIKLTKVLRAEINEAKKLQEAYSAHILKRSV